MLIAMALRLLSHRPAADTGAHRAFVLMQAIILESLLRQRSRSRSHIYAEQPPMKWITTRLTVDGRGSEPHGDSRAPESMPVSLCPFLEFLDQPLILKMTLPEPT